MAYYAGQTTPIFFTFDNFDPTSADDFIITFSKGNRSVLEFTKTDTMMTSTTVMIEMTQAQSLSLPLGTLNVQINFMVDDVRIPTDIVTINISQNLHMAVIE